MFYAFLLGLEIGNLLIDMRNATHIVTAEENAFISRMVSKSKHMHYVASGIVVTNVNPAWLENNFSVPVLVSSVAADDDYSEETCSETNSEASVNVVVGKC